MDSKPEVVFITGASAGIERATVRRFAKEGAHIGLRLRLCHRRLPRAAGAVAGEDEHGNGSRPTKQPSRHHALRFL